VKLLLQTFACMALCFLLWLGGLFWFVQGMPQQPLSRPAQADAIVVLTGGKGRLEEGFRLLAAQAAPRLFISGVGDEVGLADLFQPLPGELRAQVRKVSPAAISLGHRARNTIGNAEETREWLEGKPVRSILLVTSNYHMPRSINEFAEVLPQLSVIPAPVFSDEFPARWWEASGSRELALSEYHKFLAGSFRHWFLSVTHGL
jgi:uncharacterized SAM-binding protein YcdF (DUF218 family)